MHPSEKGLGVTFHDMDRVTSIITEVAAAEILPRFRRLEEADVRMKGPGDIVTIADEAAERELTRRLTDLLPGSTVIGEEAYAADAKVLGRVFEDAPVWIIDPVDGTQNFASGKAVFAVMVALVRRGDTVAGWIHDPVGNRTATAALGSGAWLAGDRLSVATPAPLAESTGAIKNRFFDRRMRDAMEEKKGALRETFDLYCAGHEYLRLATGEAHFALYRRMMPWDHAPGVLIHREAGGYGARLNGLPYSATETEGGLLLAPDRDSWRTLHEHLFGV